MPEPVSFQAPKGTRDLLPPEAARQRELIAGFATLAESYGYWHLATPIFEDLGVFQRVGENTEIVSKEMFEVSGRDDESRLALRPELTASVCRAFAQHRPVTPWKVFYEGPQFRHERPQAGRFRQFTQVGAEALGSDDPLLDVELIALAWRFFEALGLGAVRLLLNSLGDPEGRPAFLDVLESYLRSRSDELSVQSRTTLERNPLRVLDSKRSEDQAVISEAPLMIDHLSEAAADHFAEVTSGLDALGIAYEISPRLVRGLDYYLRTTFEFAADSLEVAQNAIGGGGRYDGLVEALGGPPTPGVGFALGIDRILMACDSEGVFAGPASRPTVFVVDLTGGEEALRLIDELGQAGIRSDRAYDRRSVKAQFKVADRSGAVVAVIVGDAERSAGTVQLKDLGSGEQTEIARNQLIDELRKRLR